jgi:hypothetical protein
LEDCIIISFYEVLGLELKAMFLLGKILSPETYLGPVLTLV